MFLLLSDINEYASNKLSSCLCAIKMWVIVSNPKKMQNNAVNMDIKKNG